MPDPVIRLNAALEGRYRIERELGEGGMATVYLADDLRHERKVALKVLKPELAAVVGAERFLAEIKTTANLQHPHILPLHDSGEADGFLFYVMPYIEGESLSERLEREKQLPVDEAIRIATDVAEALHSAHQQGVIHRDVKPANILLSQGRPLVADFGIALAVSQAGGGRLTETGLSMGTPYYMSPEQASADREPTPASDVYSLGCVLYEMLVGEPPYVGSSAQAVLAKILMGDAPAATATRPSIPANVDAAIRRALEKLPADRFASAHALAGALADQGFRHGEAAVAGVSGSTGLWNRLSVALTALILVLTGALAWALSQPEAPRSPVRFALDVDGLVSGLDISPDGSSLVLGVAGNQDQLWLRELNNLEMTPIPGTEGQIVSAPGLSPAGDEVAFNADGQVKVAQLRGGLVRTLIDARSSRPHWGSDGFIYYGGQGGRISRIPSTGGAEEAVLEQTEGDLAFRDFQLLPGGELAVFQRNGRDGTNRIEVVRLSTGDRRVLTPGIGPSVTPSGHLVFSSSDGLLMAASLDAEGWELAGQPVRVLDGLMVSGGISQVVYSLSETGTLAYRAGREDEGAWEFVWVTRSGQATPVDAGHSFPALGGNYGWRLSPDQSRIAFNHTGDIYIKYLPDGPEDRMTFSEDQDYRPFWTPDGEQVTYFSGPSAEDRNVWSVRPDGTGEPRLILDDERSFAQGSWSQDGSWLVLRAAALAAMGIGLRDIYGFRPGVDTIARPLVAAADFREDAPALSPDGRWLAYTSDETGRDEIFVRSFPNVDGARVRVSVEGGRGPLWGPSGQELFYVSGEDGLVVAEFDPAVGRISTQETLFTIPAGFPTAFGNNFYDVSADGERFLMVRSRQDESGAEEAPGIVVILNFDQELKRLVPN